MSHQIRFNKKETLEKLQKALANVAQPVIDSYGPAGGNTFLFAAHNPSQSILPTRDGITILKNILPSDEMEMFAKKLLQNASEETDIVVGDGTTTTVVVTYYLLDGIINLLKKGVEGKTIRASLKGLEKVVVDYLEKQKIDVKDTDREVIENLAYIASRDSGVANMIGEVFEKMGRDTQKEMVQSMKVEDEVEMIDGVRFSTPLISESFILDERDQSTTLTDVLVLVSDKNIKEWDELSSFDYKKGIIKILEETGKKNIVVICHDTPEGSKAFETIKKNFERAKEDSNVPKIFPVKAPQIGTSRGIILNDISAKLGAKKFVNGVDRLIDMEAKDLGYAEKFVYQDNTVTFYNPKEDVEKVKVLSEQVKNKEEKGNILEDYQFLGQRKQVLNGKYVIFKVGGRTVAEQGAKKDLVQDALRNVTSSTKDGILPGGGTVLLRLSNNLRRANPNNDIVGALAKSLAVPFQKIVTNFNSQITEDELGSMMAFIDSGSRNGFDFNKGKDEMQSEDIVKTGVVDPYKSVEQTILTAISIASEVAILKNIFINTEE
jgi:chaperonin GroEL